MNRTLLRISQVTRRKVCKTLRKIGFVNICPTCFNHITKLLSVKQNNNFIEYERICIRCSSIYIVVSDQ